MVRYFVDAETIKVAPNSPMDIAKENKAATINEGVSRGSSTEKNVLIGPALGTWRPF